MKSVKLFRYNGSQAVRLPKTFCFKSSEVIIEKRGDKVVLKPIPVHKFRDFTEIARYLAEMFPDPESFPEAPLRRQETQNISILG